MSEIILQTQADASRNEELVAEDLELVAAHEAAHVIVAQHFGAFAWFQIDYHGTRNIESEHAWSGKAFCSKLPAFRKAVVGWAGVVAEAVLHADRSGSERDDELSQLDEYIASGFCDMSESDQRFIAGHPQRRRSFTTACRIVQRHWKQIMDQVGLVVETEERHKPHAATGEAAR